MEWCGVIDRLEGSMAVVLPENSDSPLTIATALLPKGCQEGEQLRFDIRIERGRMETRKRHVQELVDQLINQQSE